MIGLYNAYTGVDGLILAVMENDHCKPQVLILTRREWGMMKRKIDNQFKKRRKNPSG